MPIDVLSVDPDHGLHQGGQGLHLLLHEPSGGAQPLNQLIIIQKTTEKNKIRYTI